MSGDRIIAGLEDAIGYMDGSKYASDFAVHHITVRHAPESIDVKAIRQRMGMTQADFASSFGLSLHTLRGWAQGTRKPDPAVRAYLRVIDRAPDTVRTALAD